MGRYLAILAGLAAAGIWGGMYDVSKVVLDVVPPFTLLALRLILGCLALAAVLVWRSQRRPSRQDALLFMGVGAVGFGLSLSLQFIGTHLSTASNAALVTSASPAFMVIFAAILLKESIKSRKLAALILASLGVLAVIDPRTAQLDVARLWGNLALLGAALTWGLYSVLVKQTSRDHSVVMVSAFGFLGGLVPVLPAAALELRSVAIGNVTPWVVAGVLYLGVVSTALAMVLWSQSLVSLEASTVSVLFFAQPVVGVGLGAWLLGDELGLAFWAGAALILVGVLAAGWDEARRPGERLRVTPSTQGGPPLK